MHATSSVAYHLSLAVCTPKPSPTVPVPSTAHLTSQGYSFSHLAQQVPICGAELTDYLHEFYTQKLGMEAGSGDCSVTRDICSTLKEAHGSLREVLIRKRILAIYFSVFYLLT